MSDHSDDDIVNSSITSKKTEDSAKSSYFLTDVCIESVKPSTSKTDSSDRGTFVVTVKSRDKKNKRDSQVSTSILGKNNEVSIVSSYRKKSKTVATQSETVENDKEIDNKKSGTVVSAYFPATELVSQPNSVQSGSERGPSPATARLLEWDSAGDVGYRRTTSEVLSTVEELALESRRGRNEVEGTPVPALSFPAAESTPIEPHIFPEVIVNRRSPRSSPEPTVRKSSSSPSTVRPKERSDSESARNGTIDSGPLSAEARVNSFEYLPGHVYESVQSGDWLTETVDPEEALESAVDQLVKLLGGKKGPKARAVIECLLDKLESPSATRESSPPLIPSADSGDHSTPESHDRVRIETDNKSLSQSPSEDTPDNSGKSLQLSSNSRAQGRRIMSSNAGSVYLTVSKSQRSLVNSKSQDTPKSSDSSSPSLNQVPDPCNRTKPRFAEKGVGTRMSSSLSGAESSDVQARKDSSNKLTHDKGVQSIYSSARSRSGTSEYATSDTTEPSVRKEKSRKKVGETSKSIPCTQKEIEAIKEQMELEKKHHLFWISSEIGQLTCLKQLINSSEDMKTCFKRIQKWKSKLKRTKEQKFDPDNLPHPSCLRPQSSSTSSTSDWTSHAYDSELEPFKQRGGGDADCIRQRVKESKVKFDRGERKQTSANKAVKYSDAATQVNKSSFKSSSLKEIGPSTSYTIQFPKSEPKVKEQSHSTKSSSDDINNVMLSVGEIKSVIDEIVARHQSDKSQKPDKSRKSDKSLQQQPSLKDYLTNERPDVVIRAEARRQIVSEIAELRKARHEARQKIIAGDTHNLPPPPLAKRVVSQKELRRQTERKYRQLGEVVNKKAEMKRKQDYRTNRLMAQVFNRKLQKKTLQGQVNLSNSVCVIGSS